MSILSQIFDNAVGITTNAGTAEVHAQARPPAKPRPRPKQRDGKIL